MLHRTRRHILTLGLLAGLSAPSWGQQQPIMRIVHGSGAGAPQDVMLRILADEISGSARCDAAHTGR